MISLASNVWNRCVPGSDVENDLIDLLHKTDDENDDTQEDDFDDVDIFGLHSDITDRLEGGKGHQVKEHNCFIGDILCK